MSSVPRTRIDIAYSTLAIANLSDKLARKELTVPPHQRANGSWDVKRKQLFIESILDGHPIPSVLISEKREGAATINTLEDGLQRLTAIGLFRKNAFTDMQGRLYRDIPEAERNRFDGHHVQVTTYSGATIRQRIDIFDRHQNGVPLSTGERYHAHSDPEHGSPLVAFAKELLMTPGSGFHDRAAAIWGVRGDTPGVETKDKKRRWLVNAIALVKGLYFGPTQANKKYELLEDRMTAALKEPVKAAVRKDLERILEIYEAVEAAVPMRKKLHNAHWDLGNFTGYILYSLSVARREAYDRQASAGGGGGEAPTFDAATPASGGYVPNSVGATPAEWQRLKAGWVAYISRIRRELQESKRKLSTLLFEHHHKGVPKTRSWILARWDDGYLRVFHPERVLERGVVEEGDDDEEEEDEMDSE